MYMIYITSIWNWISIANWNCNLRFQFAIEIGIWNLKLQIQFTHVHDIHYMNLKMNFNCNLRFQIAISICKCNWMLGKFGQGHLKGKVVFSLAYGLHRFQIQFHFQIEISNCNSKLHMYMIYITWIWNWISIVNWNQMLDKIWQVHLQTKVVFSLAYGLNRFQIQFQLQIEIAIWYFKLLFHFAIEIECWANFGKFT